MKINLAAMLILSLTMLACTCKKREVPETDGIEIVYESAPIEWHLRLGISYHQFYNWFKDNKRLEKRSPDNDGNSRIAIRWELKGRGYYLATYTFENSIVTHITTETLVLTDNTESGYWTELGLWHTSLLRAGYIDDEQVQVNDGSREKTAEYRMTMRDDTYTALLTHFWDYDTEHGYIKCKYTNPTTLY